MSDYLKPTIPYAEFYITNVCNLNCNNCNRLNNFYFSGHQSWKDYSDIYQTWGKKLDIQKINILGGEPLLNPSVLEWMSGIRAIWPKAELLLTSNGTRLNFHNKLYQTLKDNDIQLILTTHNKVRHEEILQNLKENFLVAPVAKKYQIEFSDWVIHEYNNVKDQSWPTCKNIHDFYQLPECIQTECRDVHKIDPEKYLSKCEKIEFKDSNNVYVELIRAENFYTAPLAYNGHGKFSVYNSNPTKAHDACISKYCHHFIKGKFYKCHHVALLPEFMQQFFVDISDEDKKLLESYRPLTVNSSDDDIYEFLANLRKEMPQCKLCPAELQSQYFQSDTNKIKIVKRRINHEI